MSDQPTFRPRVMPMPKKNDWIIIHTSNGRSKKGLAYNIDEIDFMVDCGDKCYRRKIEAKTWNFADRTVEAQRLMEAAYRADTSELPEEAVKAIEWLRSKGEDLHSKSGGIPKILCRIIETIGDYVTDDGANYRIEPMDSAEICFDYLPHLLRWQAQQEQK